MKQFLEDFPVTTLLETEIYRHLADNSEVKMGIDEIIDMIMSRVRLWPKKSGPFWDETTGRAGPRFVPKDLRQSPVFRVGIFGPQNLAFFPNLGSPYPRIPKSG